MIEIRNLTKTFSVKDNNVEALKNINLTINDGDIYGIIGMSGAGKSTLVRCINMLERPTLGTVLIDDIDIGQLPAEKLREIRRNITMIFQSFNLLAQRSCLKNICFPLEISGVKKSEAKKRALELLEVVGLSDKAYAYPSQLSGGQQQRIAIARAIATNPKVLLCDEATSALDPKTTGDILTLLRSINQQFGITIIVITHQMHVIEEICNRVAILDNGSVVEEGPVTDIFTKPQSSTAKQLVFLDDAKTIVAGDNERLVRVVFDGNVSADIPLIATMATEENIIASIKYASTKTISSKAYGNMILSLPNDDATVKRAIGFMNKANVFAKEL